MARVITRRRKTKTVYTVRWREGGPTEFSRTFPTRDEADTFKAEIAKAWPHRARGGVFKPIKQRIEESVAVDGTGCWVWTRKIGTTGYGQMTIQVAGKPKTRSAHRVSYEAYIGPVPRGLDLDHLCRVRRCVNPKHLEPVTRRENLYRSPIHKAWFRGQGLCTRQHVLAEVGTVKMGKYRYCAVCSRENNRASAARRRARLALAGEQA